MNEDTVGTMEQPRKLTAQDRCDRCGAAACVTATLPAGTDLLFCAHHFNENAVALENAGARITDERDAQIHLVT